MAIRTILVCETQVPFVTGGAESLVSSLVSNLRAHGYKTDVVSIPFKWYPRQEILTHAAAWRLLDLSESNGQSVDMVIATKFPTYFVRHECKVVWLVHQHRAAYDLVGTEFSDFAHSELDVGVRDSLLNLDTKMLKECQRRFTISDNTTKRLQKYNGVSANTLYPPPRLAERLHGGPYGNYILSVGRLESIKRIDLLLRAMASVDSSIRLVIVGEGTHRRHFEAVAEDCGVDHRVEFTGRVDDNALIDLYAGALAVAFVPYDEDYGFVTVEAFLSKKPVVTVTDSGGPLEFVEDGINGAVCEPDPESISITFNALAADRSRAASLGDAGYDKARSVTWHSVIKSLVE